MSVAEYVAAWANGCANLNEVIGLIEVASLIEEDQFGEVACLLVASHPALKTVREAVQHTIRQAIDQAACNKPACTWTDSDGDGGLVDITWEAALLCQMRFIHHFVSQAVRQLKHTLKLPDDFIAFVNMVTQHGPSRSIRSLSQCILRAAVKSTQCEGFHSDETVSDKGFQSLAAQFKFEQALLAHQHKPKPQPSKDAGANVNQSTNQRSLDRDLHSRSSQLSESNSRSHSRESSAQPSPPDRQFSDHNHSVRLTQSSQHERHGSRDMPPPLPRIQSHRAESPRHSDHYVDRYPSFDNSSRSNTSEHHHDMSQHRKSNSYDSASGPSDHHYQSHHSDIRQHGHSSERSNQRLYDETINQSTSRHSHDRDLQISRHSRSSCHSRESSRSPGRSVHLNPSINQSRSPNRSSSYSSDHRVHKPPPFAILPDRQHAESNMQPCWFFVLGKCFSKVKCPFVHLPYLKCFQELAQNVGLSPQQVNTHDNDFMFAPRWRLVDVEGARAADEYEMLLPFPARDTAMTNFGSEQLKDFVHAIIGRSKPFAIKGTSIGDRPTRNDARWARLLARARLDDLTRLQQGIAYLIDHGFCSLTSSSERAKLIEKAEQQLD